MVIINEAIYMIIKSKMSLFWLTIVNKEMQLKEKL